MSNYNQQEFDFIKRTQAIIDRYDKLKIPEEEKEKEKYEVTLLLNCLVGLLILPQQHWFEILPSDPITEKEWGISEGDITDIWPEKSKITRKLMTPDESK